MTNRRLPLLFAAIPATLLILFAIATPSGAAGQGAKPTPPAKKGEAAAVATAYPLWGDYTNQGGRDTFFRTTNAEGGHYGFVFEDTWASDTTLRAYGAARGVMGEGTSYGVQGIAGTSGTGVWGEGGGGGVHGVSTNGDGVSGTTSNARGVYGFSNTGDGVVGQSNSGYGVFGITSGADKPAVYGEANFDNASGASGVKGSVLAYAGAAYGVYGVASGNSAVYGGYFTSAAGTGLAGVSTSGFGVYGYSTNSYGLTGGSNSNTAIRATSNSGIGLYANSASNYGGRLLTSTGFAALRATDSTPGAGSWAIIADGNVLINGSLSCTGACLAMSAKTDQGERLVYPEAATTARISDEGSARLKDGRAIITIDPLFAQTVDLSGGYQVYLTPGDFGSKGLAFGNLSPTSFEVRELAGGKGGYSFSWRITAPRKGDAARLAPAPSAPTDSLPQP